ncbi:MAG: group 1 truncated hemoglobin [Zetaproteobacteria bacterium CG12_big_fil_rev_8_21_14_0_65_54_13]|nr:MAG: group 1 truncated hemoglobin [Zetaproteobacteria bacterium CG12_big_fil_rev_8_21_14_0_65_54_13]PIX53265.1 MAG: group 1 truncated hemoglobin [Zetaproteobacteria bacterium CG_4_10_14_3_um_filter_54_28]PJA31017.1 MAG: group 1 truncated hemoglobin [Zetaproteobacteria bacterium CG_4_9_14_3_um_filter_54_145]
MSSKASLFDLVGGLPVLEAVHKRFYDKMYAHPWLGTFFKGHDQRAIELRQTQFMGWKMGGEINYPGMELELAHRRMYITSEQLELRQAILRESLQEEYLPAALIKRWLKIDAAFWSHIKNDSLASFQQIDLKYEQPLIVPNPHA